MTMASNTVSVIGADGMLGRAVVRALKADAKDFHVHEVNRTPGASIETLAPYIINCAGVVRGRRDVSPERMVKDNALLPHYLAGVPHLKRMVTVSTDCVFDGGSGPYHENSRPTPTDLYSRSKLAGEILDNEKVLTVRSSFIGFGIRGLLRWVLQQDEGVAVEGYSDQLWNGLYVETAARAIVHLCLRKQKITGLLHLKGEQYSKASLLRTIGAELRPDLTVVDTLAGSKDLRLLSRRHDDFDVATSFGLSFKQLFADYHEWGREYLCSL